MWPCPFNKLKRKNSRSPKSRSWTIMDCLQKRNRRRNVNARQKIWTNAIITRLKCKSKDIAYASRKKNHVLYGRMEQRPMCPGTTGSDSTSGPRGAETLSTSPPADSAPSPSLPPLPPPPPSYCSSTLPPIKGTCYDLNIFHLFFTEKDFFQCFFFRPKFRVYMQNFGKVSGCMEPVTAAFSNHRATTYLLWNCFFLVLAHCNTFWNVDLFPSFKYICIFYN